MKTLDMIVCMIMIAFLVETHYEHPFHIIVKKQKHQLQMKLLWFGNRQGAMGFTRRRCFTTTDTDSEIRRNDKFLEEVSTVFVKHKSIIL